MASELQEIRLLLKQLAQQADQYANEAKLLLLGEEAIPQDALDSTDLDFLIDKAKRATEGVA